MAPRRSRGVVSSSLIAVLAAAGISCAPPDRGGATGRPAEAPDPTGAAASARSPRLMIVGLDGFSWDVALPLVRAGEMPVFERLLEESSWGVLESIEPMLSPVLWTSVATGFTREEHGIGFFTVKARGRYEMRTVDSTMRRRPAFWEILNRRGVRVGLVNWPVTFPAENVDGFCVSSEYSEEHGDSAPFLHPPGLEAEVRAALSARVRLPGAFGSLVFLDPQVRRTCEKDFKVHLVARRLAARHRPEVIAVTLAGADVVSHLFWQAHEPAGRPSGIPGEEPGADFVADYYRFLDHLMGGLTADLPPETYLLVLSDHGARGIEPDEFVGLDLNRLLALLGFQSADGEGIRWEETAAFNLGDYLNTERAIFINVSGQEERGAVPPADRASMAERVAVALRAVRDSEGRPLFESVRLGAGDGDGAADQGWHQTPDLVVEVRSEAHSGGAILVGGVSRSPRDLFVKHYPHLGTHAAEGIILCRGPGVRRGFGMGPRGLLDAFPTILHLSGLPVPGDAPGRPVLEMFEAGHLARHPAGTVATYGLRDEGAGAPQSPLERGKLEKLRALGYIR